MNERRNFLSVCLSFVAGLSSCRSVDAHDGFDMAVSRHHAAVSVLEVKGRHAVTIHTEAVFSEDTAEHIYDRIKIEIEGVSKRLSQEISSKLLKAIRE